MSDSTQHPKIRLAYDTSEVNRRLIFVEDRVSIIQTFEVRGASLSDAMRALAQGAWVKIQDGVVYTTDPQAFEPKSD